MAGAFLLSPRGILARTEELAQHREPPVPPSESAAAEYTLRIETSPVEIAPKRIISITTYNGQFPGALLRFKEGEQVTVGTAERVSAIVENEPSGRLDHRRSRR
jgi:FtsP/CotA-like multicopper oxidase with cupredoxin domain